MQAYARQSAPGGHVRIFKGVIYMKTIKIKDTRQKKAIRAELNETRKDWTGLRPTTFRDRTKYSKAQRSRDKASLRYAY